MVNSLMNRRRQEPVTVMVYTPIHDSVADRDTPSWVDGLTVDCIVNMPATAEILDVGQDLLSRRQVVRYFGALNITDKDRVRINGETWAIDGLPKVSKILSGGYLTTFYINKAGKN